MRRYLARPLAYLAAVLIALATTLQAAPDAHAANSDVIQEWTQTYVVETSGVTHVTETLVYQFSSPSTSHGLQRDLVIREPYQPDDAKDRVYEISNITVAADKPVSTSFTTTKVQGRVKGKASARNENLRIRVGDANSYVNEDVVTYTLTYDISGAVISPEDGDEFYWDVIPVDAPTTLKADISVTMPGSRVVKQTCNVGGVGATGGCASSTTAGQTGHFAASQLGHGRGMTVSMIVPDGTVTGNQPHLVDSADRAAKQQTIWSLAATAATTLLSIFGGLAWWRKNGRDERFLGVPPGLMPASGQESTIGRDNKPEIPVQFTPPPITVGEAGMLVDGRVDVRDTTATLMQLAVNGGLRLNADPQQDLLSVTLMNPAVATAPHERVLMLSLFGGAAPGTTVDLRGRATMYEGHRDVVQMLRQVIRDRGWYKKFPNALTGGLSGLIPIVLGVVFFFPGAVGSVLMSGALFWLLPVLPLVILLIVLTSLRKSGQRSAVGRAVADQVEGFRTYLTTAEAEQLTFEEGEDIFSRYLPWAIMFGVAERWTRVCQRLVELGRVQDMQPSWYYGPWGGYGYFPTVYIDQGLNTSAMPEVQSSTDSGFGSGGSSFGGGSVGGGGGGGSVGSW